MGGNGPWEIRVCTRSNAANAVYHQACSVNFRTRKQILKKHGNDTDSTKELPTNEVKSKAFF